MTEIEISPTNRTTCFSCGKTIEKGELRIKELTGYSGLQRFPNYSYYCYQDGINMLRDKIHSIEDVIRDVRNKYDEIRLKTTVKSKVSKV